MAIIASYGLYKEEHSTGWLEAPMQTPLAKGDHQCFLGPYWILVLEAKRLYSL